MKVYLNIVTLYNIFYINSIVVINSIDWLFINLDMIVDNFINMNLQNISGYIMLITE